jgi:hypothetical protein
VFGSIPRSSPSLTALSGAAPAGSGDSVMVDALDPRAARKSLSVALVCLLSATIDDLLDDVGQ